MKYALVNHGNGEGWVCMAFENKAELLSYCQSYHYQPISVRESKKHSDVKTVRSFGSGNDKCWKW